MSFRARSIKALIRNRGNRTEGQRRVRYSIQTLSVGNARCSLSTRFQQGPGQAQYHGARVSDQPDHWMKRASLCFSTVPSVEVQPGFSPTVSWGYDGEESATHPVYFSHKARVVYRHQMDGNIIDATC
ncbi:LOW QUALITY PROTEIN: uncharacterized protein si:ch211-237l4.6 [Pimephales promelas]|uniref:LOW QUALITY PROTEIN: uncharacterized protein si:ch211-237l4.6 n=1 Tax=Pimephales promelas TaxID=90988 RepID=UPI001955DFA3|nr:LOW QUALITY PROTEIN: uncharacterized protein si:ch211-237l4.6 [Pimephales promelas]